MLKSWRFRDVARFAPPGEGGAQGAGDDAGAAGAGDDQGAAGAGDDKAKSKDWRDKEIGRKHAQLQASKAREAELEAELETTRALLARGAGGAAGGDAGAADDAARGQPMPRAEIEAEAQRIVLQQNFNKSANDADAAGRERYGDKWDDATGTLKTLGGFDSDTMTNILATDDPAKVLYELGANPENYQRIMDLPPARRFAEMVKLGLPEKVPAKKPSGAPAPVERVRASGRGDANALNDELSDDDWYARRKRQKDARFAAKQQGRAG